MRAIKSSLLAIWLLALLVAAGSTLVERHTGRVKSPSVVYVDRAKLIVLHPAWQQVLSVRAAIADLKGEAAKPVYLSTSGIESCKESKISSTASGKSRHELARELEQRAFSELSYIEARERKKIEQDLAAKRQELDAAAQAAVARKSEEIKLRIASEERGVKSTRLHERLETEFRIVSIKSRLKSLDASEEQKARRDLADAQGLLSVFDSQTQKCVDDQCEAAKDELERFKVRERLSVESELSQLRAERENQLERNIRKQQEILLAGVHTETVEKPAEFTDVQTAPRNVRRAQLGMAKLSVHRMPETGKDAAKAVKRLQRLEQRLVARILHDVTDTAESVASEQGFIVTFKPNKAIRDITGQIAEAVSGPGKTSVSAGKGRAG